MKNVKNQLTFVFALLMIASLVTEGDFFSPPIPGKRETMRPRICRAARSLGCKNIVEQGLADDIPLEERKAAGTRD
ncbi:hypothetical protein ABFA07_010731 [Porites harrisoni]